MATADATRMQENRAAARDLTIPPIFDPKRRAACEADDCEWLRVYLPGVFYNPFTERQKGTIEACGNVMRYGTKKCTADERGGGKSSTIKYLALKYALSRQLRFPLAVAATHKKAGDILDGIKHHLSLRFPSPLTQDYPVECVVARYVDPWPSRARNVTANGRRSINVEWGADTIILPTFEDEEPMGPILRALSITSDDLQGCNVYDIRPDFVLLDDLDSRDSLASEDGKIAGKIEETIDKTIAGMAGQSKSLGIYMLCTITSRKSAAFKYSDPAIKPAYDGERIAAILVWPKNKDLWDTYLEYRQWGTQTKGEDGKKAIDMFGRKAHQFYLDNRAAMDEGAELSNPFNFKATILPDGSQQQVSSLQRCYDYIADHGMDSFLTEHQNDPPADEDTQQLVLTSYHIQNNCKSETDKHHVPEGAVTVTIGGDVQKLGLHWAAIASDERGASCVIDYDFFEFQTAGRKAPDCELLILEGLFAWHEAMQENPFIGYDGEEIFSDLTLIDAGWKDKSWAAQPVQTFCAQVGLQSFIPSKGTSPYHIPKPSKQLVIGDNWHWDAGQMLLFMNSDHWKLKVHEGFLAARGEPGSLSLCNPPSIDGRVNRTGNLSYAKHCLAETYEARFVPGFKGWRKGWWKTPKPNHWFDATYAAIVARSMRGISVLSLPASAQQHPAIVAPVHTIEAPQANYSPRNRW